MRHRRYAFLTCGLLLTIGAARAGDDAARALVERAIKAQGGAAALGKFQAVTGKMKGIFHGLGAAVGFTGEFAAQGTDRHKVILDLEQDGQKVRVAQVLLGNKGWSHLNGETQELDREALAEAQEEAYAEWVATLLPLKERKFKLTPAGEIRVGKRPALGVTVSSKGRRDVKLYFDKESGLLVKSEARVKDDNGQEVPEETFYSDYRDVQGTRQAMKLTVRRDGEPYLECVLTEYRLVERLDAGVFARP